MDRTRVGSFDLVRLNHYHTRFMTHQQSQKIERANLERVRKRLLGSFARYRYVGEMATDLVSSAFAAIETARSVLIWSFPAAFFMKPGSSELARFEFVQGGVLRQIESLTHVVEVDAAPSPERVVEEVKMLEGQLDSLNRYLDAYSV